MSASDDAALSITIDDSGLTAGVTKMTNAIGPSSIASALSVGFELMRLSQQQVPHDKGSLQNSGTVQQIGDDVIVGYHEPYAARLHEHPEYNFQKGRKGKYLSDPIIDNAGVLGLRFATNFQSGIE